jgi:hypothetical protein
LHGGSLRFAEACSALRRLALLCGDWLRCAEARSAARRLLCCAEARSASLPLLFAEARSASRRLTPLLGGSLCFAEARSAETCSATQIFSRSAETSYPLWRLAPLHGDLLRFAETRSAPRRLALLRVYSHRSAEICSDREIDNDRITITLVFYQTNKR